MMMKNPSKDSQKKLSWLVLPSSTQMSITMKEWLQNELYQELLKMPLWTLSAFGFLNDGDILRSDDVRYNLIIHLVMNHIEKVPGNVYDNEYRHSWKVKDFIETIKFAVKSLRNTKEQKK